MALKNVSEIDMIQGPEFINLQPLDVYPLMQQCEIKVFYLGHNRNGSRNLSDAPVCVAFREPLRRQDRCFPQRAVAR